MNLIQLQRCGPASGLNRAQGLCTAMQPASYPVPCSCLVVRGRDIPPMNSGDSTLVSQRLKTAPSLHITFHSVLPFMGVKHDLLS